MKQAKGKPKYNKGDKVFCSIAPPDSMTVESSFWNGFTWMYYFEENEMGIGQQYLTPAPKETNEA